MSAQKTISNSFTVTTMEDPVSVQAQYAPNNNPTAGQIHNVWQDGDLYMRTRETDSNVWSSWHKIVGESGGETDFTFNISKNKTSSSATTAPSDCYYQNWQDAPVAPTSTYPYLWMKIVEKTWNASTQSYDSGTARYARVTGEAGANAPYIELSRTTILYNANNEGKSTASQNFPITYALKVNGNTCTISSVDNITISLPSNVTVVSGTKTTSGCTINCTHSVVISGVITITITGTYNGQTYTASGSITVEANKEGAKGEKGDTGDQGGKGDRGKIGRFYYYAQVWTNSSSVSYAVTDTEAPFFSYNNQYWVFNPESNGTYTMSSMGTPSSSNTNWKMMVTDFKYIITEAIFGSFAHFGSAIISGDWLMSTNGYINGTAFNNTNISGGIVGGSSFSVKAYTLFDENYPLGDNTTIHESSDTTSVASSSTSVTRASSIYLTAGYTYCLVCSGYTSNASHPVYGRIQDSSGNYTVTVNLNSTSAVQRSGYFRVASSGYYSIVLTQDSGYTGTVTYSKIARVRFAPNYCVDLLTGKSYQNDAYIKGQIVATSGSIDSVSATNLTIKSGTITGDVTVGSGSVQIKLQPLGSGTSVGASIKAYDGTLVPFSLSFDRYYYGGTYAPHATLKLESVYPYSSQCGSVTLTDRTTERVLYYGSSQTPDSTYRTYDGYRSITNFSGMVRELSVNNTYYLRMGITATGVAAIIASAWPTSSDKSSLPTGCIYRDGENLKVKT